MDVTLPMLAGMVSTAVFVGSVLPMLHKAFRTRELSSYSFGNIALANLGNVVHSVYVFHLPPGPIWVLHTFYLVSSGLMLYWYVGGRGLPRSDSSTAAQAVPVGCRRSGRGTVTARARRSYVSALPANASMR